MKIAAGIDVGSRSAQTVLYGDESILAACTIDTGPDSLETAEKVFTQALSLLGIERRQVNRVFATGYGRLMIPFAYDIPSEISCHARGAFEVFPQVRTILDMGGQDCKAIRCDAKGHVVDFVMNDKCAGGTGRFFEIIASVLGIDIEEMGPLALRSTEAIPFNNRCAVFAKSETLGLVRRGVAIEHILAGLNEAVSRRVVALLNKVGVVDEIVITGGIAKNSGMVSKIEKQLGLSVLIPEEPQIIGALGAAVLATESLNDGH